MMIAIARARTFLSRLVRNQAGNTLAIAAAALLPLIALSGGAVDASRAYMAKTQLQAACDAGVLAGRRALGKTGQYGTSEKAKAQQMFSANFNGAQFGIANPTFTTSANSQNDVFGNSAIALPTVVMKIFNFRTLNMSVDCMAELQVANTDVMFVLDTTGSMGTSGIDGLRGAVKDFHKTLANANIDSETRVRYGFVPYSLTVNAKGLLTDGELSKTAFETNVRYPTAVANFQTKDTILTNETTTKTYTEDYSNGYLSQSDCKDWGDNYGNSPVIDGTTGTYYSFDSWKYKVKWYGTRYGTCQREVKITQGTQKTIYRFTDFVYQDATVDVEPLLSFSSTNYADKGKITSDNWVESRGAYDLHQLADMAASGSASATSTKSYTWDGCILERKTVVDYNFNPAPSGAYDHAIDLLPNVADEQTLWKPRWNELAYQSNGNQPSGDGIACPAQMKALREVDMSSETVPNWLDTYLNTLFNRGYTYHDIGMIWGARLGSAKGPFASIVNDRPNQAVSRHLIFMTDGAMQPERTANSSYGIEVEEHQVAPDGTYNGTLKEYHNNRFAAACREAKAEGYTIWVIAFGTTITDQLKNCSTGGRAYFSSNTTELRQRFAYIASQVADLRLGQ